MLTLLHIENIAVIELADVEFGGRLNVLTGETGAGKSIVIDALNAITGERTPRDIIRTGCSTATISGVFSALSNEVLSWLSDNGYEPEEDGTLLIQRTLGTDGKNICKLNGRPVTVSLLRQLGGMLLTIHGQHDGQRLLNEQTHLSYLDSFAGHKPLLEAYYTAYRELRKKDAEIGRLKIDEDEKEWRIDELRSKIEEIELAGLTPGEQNELEARRIILRNAEKITSAIDEAFALIYGGEDFDGAYAMLDQSAEALRSVSDTDVILSALYARVEQLRILAEEAANDIRDIRDDYEFDQQESDRIEERLDQLYRIKRKYRSEPEELLETLNQWKAELDEIEFSEEALLKLEKKRAVCLAETEKAAAELSKSRRLAAAELSGKIQEQLHQLDMTGAVFEVNVTGCGTLGENGIDEVRFLMSANAGEPPKPIAKIASGGELARVMLAMKSILAAGDEVQTLIFDEIDTGVSGRAAQRVAEKLAEVGQIKQVLCVTHLPQIAAMADEHYLIEKKESKGRTFTSVTKLDSAGRIDEVARTISGKTLTDSARMTASELIEAGKNYKARQKAVER